MTVIFDLDDTLIDTSDLFWKVREDYISLLGVKGETRKEIRDYFEKEDSISILEKGFDPGRYTYTMLKVYDYYREKGKITASKGLEEAILATGNRISSTVPEMLPGAKELLEGCKKNKIKMALLTRGSEQVQRMKISSHSLRDYFGDNTYIVAKKTENEFRSVMEDVSEKKETTWIIGDSIKSDINPGLKIGANCIHYKYFHEEYTWIQEHDAEPINNNYAEVSSLYEAKEILLKATGRFLPKAKALLP